MLFQHMYPNDGNRWANRTTYKGSKDMPIYSCEKNKWDYKGLEIFITHS